MATQLPAPLVILVRIFFALLACLAVNNVAFAQGEDASLESQQIGGQPSATDERTLSPYWAPGIQRWSSYIVALAEKYGFDPDFIAAVIRHESLGDHSSVSYMGAVGLMGVMPTGPGLEWRPSSSDLLIPATNLRWGITILSVIVQQSGGDLASALAAYNGGWKQVQSRVPREYAERVLDSYARALVARTGMAHESATRWTIAIEIPSGNIPVEPLLVLGRKPISELRLYADHTVYQWADEDGTAYHIRAYAVPVGLTDTFTYAPQSAADAHMLEPALRSRLGEKSTRSAYGNERLLLACLPRLNRLRGEINTRWYSPSQCPAAGR